MLNISRRMLLIAALAAFGRPGTAGAIDVTVDTTSLIGHPAGPFYIYYTFTDGSGIGDQNNTVNLGNFDYGGGFAFGNAIGFGGVTGSLETGITITDSSFLSVFYEQFMPGTRLNFSLSVTSNDDASAIPDRLSFYILDSSGIALPTLAPAGDYFLSADLSSNGVTFGTYASDTTRAPSVGPAVSIPAPGVSSIPEPASMGLIAFTLAGILGRRFAPK